MTMIYDLLWSNPLSSISYLLLLFSILSLWIKQEIKIWGAITAASLVCGVISDRVDIIGVIPIVILCLLYHTVNSANIKFLIRTTSGVLAIILSVMLAAHLIPGFSNWKILDNVSLTETSLPYSMYLNMDKTLVGLTILGLGYPLIKSLKEWASVLRSTLPIFLVGLIVLASVSQIFGYTHWDFKFPALFFVWALKNLFFTCVSEEAFFRGFLQRNLFKMLQEYKYGNILSLIIVSILFGLAHFAGGFKYVILATMAGIAYGYAYQKTQRIEASILCHFGVNTFHFIFLTYPALANT
jgi:membrane protease YdiL (CAAX protease family)